MQRTHRHSWITWLAIAALLAQTWLGPHALAVAAGQSDGLVICSGDGFKVIPLAAAGEAGLPDLPADGPAGPSAGFDCVACLHGAIGAANLAAPSLVVQQVEHDVVAFEPVHEQAAPKIWLKGVRSRAPPLV
jgi:hypothetical protein